MTAIIPFEMLVDVVRLKLYESLTVDGVLRPDVAYIAKKLDGKVTKAFVTSALRQLELSKHIEVVDKQTGVFILLRSSGIRAVERHLSDPESIASRFRDRGFDAFEPDLIHIGKVPASDRLVSLDHNSAEFKEAQAVINEIKEALLEDNEVGEALGDDRQVAIAEVVQVNAVLNQPRFRLVSFLALATRTFSWLAEKSGGTVVGELSKKLLNLISSWIF